MISKKLEKNSYEIKKAAVRFYTRAASVNLMLDLSINIMQSEFTDFVSEYHFHSLTFSNILGSLSFHVLNDLKQFSRDYSRMMILNKHLIEFTLILYLATSFAHRFLEQNTSDIFLIRQELRDCLTVPLCLACG